MMHGEKTVDLPACVKELVDDALERAGGEVPRIRDLFSRGLVPLAQLLRALYGERVTLNGVFCHGRPIVDFDHPEAPAEPRGCELGDLLVAVNHLHDGGSQSGRALLVQAKVLGGDVPKRQELLYRDWPEFAYRADHLQRRRVTGGEHRGAQFGFLSSDRPFLLAQQPEAPADDSWDRQFSLELVEMIQSHLRGGREFYAWADRSSDSSGWSTVVWDLLSTTFSGDTYKGVDRVIDRSHATFYLQQSAFPEALRTGPNPQGCRSLWATDAGDRSEHSDELPDNLLELDRPAISCILIEVDQRLDRPDR